MPIFVSNLEEIFILEMGYRDFLGRGKSTPSSNLLATFGNGSGSVDLHISGPTFRGRIDDPVTRMVQVELPQSPGH